MSHCKTLIHPKNRLLLFCAFFLAEHYILLYIKYLFYVQELVLLLPEGRRSARRVSSPVLLQEAALRRSAAVMEFLTVLMERMRETAHIQILPTSPPPPPLSGHPARSL